MLRRLMRQKKIFLMLLLVFGMASFIGAQYEDEVAKDKAATADTQVTAPRGPLKYRWPLEFDNGFSSAFQEYRSSHFHGGIDLRTQQKTGFPVAAISDGYIYKIRVVKRGSGRGLYLKHNDGNISIYFHLDRFEPKLENLLKRLQKIQKKKYIGNYFLKKPLYYKRGQVMAFSGETGSGYPHLHLEVRDRLNFALNPFKYLSFPSKDKNHPVLSKLLLRHRGSASINGGLGETLLSFRSRGSSTYVIDKPVLVTGHLDLLVRAYDRSDVGMHSSPYSISVTVDNRLFYRINFDRFQRDDNNQLGFVYDLNYSRSGNHYYNLFSQKGFQLESEHRSFNELLDELDYGKHELRIRVEDNFKNVSVGIVKIYKVQEPQLKISGVKHLVQEKQIHFNINTLKAQEGGEIRINVYDRSEILVSSGSLNHHLITQCKPLILKGVPKDASYIDFDFYFQGTGYRKRRVLINQNHLPGMTDISFTTFVNRDEVFIKILEQRLGAENVRLKVVQGEYSVTLEPQFSNNQLFFSFKPHNEVNDVMLHFTLLKESEAVVGIQKKMKLVYLREGGEQRFKYHEFQAYFAKRAVYEPKVLVVEERQYNSDFPVLSRQVSLSPYGFPFLDTVYYKFQKKCPNSQQVGIFKYNHRNGNWSSRFSQYDKDSATYSHRLISSGTFALMRDIFPPKVSFSRPRTRFKKKVWRLTVKISDKGKGVNDSSIKVWLNGKRICTAYNCDCEYDPDWSALKIQELKHLKTGKNLLKVEVKDYAGNKTEKIFRFNLQ
jgi:Peptidase family M23